MKYHVGSSHKTVWIHDQNGQCVGRFNKYSGEILSGAGYTVKVNYQPWDEWKKEAEAQFEIEIPEGMKPDEYPDT